MRERTNNLEKLENLSGTLNNFCKEFKEKEDLTTLAKIKSLLALMVIELREIEDKLE